MKSSQEKITLTLLGLMLASLLILGGCSDTSMPSQDDQVVTIPVVTVPSSAEALAVVISGSVIDQSTGNIVDNATVSFFEGASAATNIFDTSGDAITSPLSVSGGSFQVSAENNITSFSVDVSAVDYLDSSLDINFAPDDKTVVFQIALIPEATKSVAVKIKEETVNPKQLTAAVEVTTEAGGQDNPVGSAGLVIVKDTELQDAQGNTVSGSTLSVEITYVESQEAEASDDGEISIANVIPEGLNGNTQGADVLIPVGIAEINMSVGDTEVKKFEPAITVTINLPKETIFPSRGQAIAKEDRFTVRSYDEDTKLWTTEDSLATVGDLDGEVYPANFEVDHLTFFALADPVAACESDVAFTFTGDQIPDNSLIMSLQSDEIYQSELLSSVDANGAVLSATANKFLPLSENTAEPGAASKELGLAANAAATVTVKDLSGNVWYQSQSNISICGQTIDVELDNPVETVSENLDISLVCSNDSLVFNELQNAVVSYRKDNNSVAVLATEGAAGSYALTGLDLSAAEYSVTVDTRTSAGVQTTTIVPDGTDETLEVSIPCSVATGTGTGTGSS